MPRWTLVLAALLLPFYLATADVVELAGHADALSVRVIESSDTRTLLEYELGSFVRSEIEIAGETYYAIDADGESKILKRGFPELPNVCRSIIVPDDAGTALRVVSSHYVEFQNVPVAPSKGVLTRDIDPATVAHTFDPFYESDAWYPQELAYARDPYIMRDYRGVVVVVNPFRYNAGTKTLRVYDSVVVEIAHVGPGKVNVLRRRPPGAINGEFTKIYERHFLNYEAMAKDRYTSVGEIGNMLVISYESFMPSMVPFVEWKKQMGVPCEMVSVTDAGGTSTAIKSYIQDYYDTNGLTFVLLVGDAAEVPTPTAAGGSSDPSYSLTAGSDNYPDLFVGRFSAQNTAQVGTQVLRSVEYEKYPQSGADWYHKGTGIASDQGPGDDGEYDYEHMDNIRTDLLGFTYTEVDQIYDPTGTAAMVSAALNEGRGIVDYVGHGSVTGWGSSGFSSTHVNALTNDNMLPFIISVACVNGNFANYTCFAETWLRATNSGEPTGAVGTYMSSINQSWNSPMCGQDEMIDLLVAEEKRTYGGICYNGSCQMIDEYYGDGENMFLTWHIFGDPSLRVITDTPTALSVVHDSTVPLMTRTFDVTVAGIEGALCALYGDSTLYGSGLTDATGDVTIDIVEPLPADRDVTLTVTAFNSLPYFGTVHVGPYFAPQISVDRTSFVVSMEPDALHTDTLGISNIGEAFSILNYEIEIVDASVKRNLTGSDVTVSPTEYVPGTTGDFVFTIYNGSPDNEWVVDATLDFPAGVVVNSCTDFATNAPGILDWDGTTGDGASVNWHSATGAPGWWPDVVPQYGTGTATVNLTIDAGFTGDIEIDYTLEGDVYGFEPHTVYGTVVIEPLLPSVTLTAPNGGEAWGTGETHDITWDWIGSFDFVALDCSSDSGGSWWTIISSTENDGVHPWLVDGPVSNNCYVRVTGQTTPSIDDMSDGPFSIFRPVTWMSAVPMSGSVPEGDTDYVELTFDTAGMTDGDYFADIVITSDGGNETVPVTLKVRTSGVGDDWPRTLVLYGNYPNPFMPRTRIAFALPRPGNVTVSIYDVSGRLVRVIENVFRGGKQEIAWDGKNRSGDLLSSGIYFYRLEADGVEVDGKMVLMK